PLYMEEFLSKGSKAGKCLWRLGQKDERRNCKEMRHGGVFPRLQSLAGKPSYSADSYDAKP
ncbi:hypothetical protein BaRGS_00011127, partial [Batillaria attramentaria]